VLSCSALGGTVVANDSFTGGQATFPAGFVTDEESAVRLVPPDAGVWRIDDVLVLYGGASGTVMARLNIYDDGALTTMPGASLLTSDVQITASDAAFSALATSVLVAGPFRLGIQHRHDGAPSVAIDGDGIRAGRNFVKLQGLGWTPAESVGFAGDFILRAELTLVDGGAAADSGVPDGGAAADSGVPDAGPTPDSGVPDAGTTPDSGVPDAGSTPDSGAPDAGGAADSGAPDAGGMTDAGSGPPGFGAACRVNSECQAGLYCGSGSCTYECRKDIDCAAGEVCSALGRCESAPKSCGCSSALAALPLALLVGALRRARRRR
jgi:hypothetical protein